MNNAHGNGGDDKGSGILQEALQVQRCRAKDATHFVLCKGNKIKFFIHLQGGEPHLLKCVKAYSGALALLLKLLPIIPYRSLQMAGLGYYAKVNAHAAIQKCIPSGQSYNILVGTYDSAQKLVLQCFNTTQGECTFIKVGNAGSAEQMEREIKFLQAEHNFRRFSIPQISAFRLRSETEPFNIQVTQEFHGEKTEPVMTPELYAITREIAGESTVTDGREYEFTHGDFAPWNIRTTASGYTVFDWEHCGLRPKGYDAAYFIIMTEVALRGCSFAEAFETAVSTLREIDPALQLDYQLIYQEFAKTTKALSF